MCLSDVVAHPRAESVQPVFAIALAIPAGSPHAHAFAAVRVAERTSIYHLPEKLALPLLGASAAGLVPLRAENLR